VNRVNRVNRIVHENKEFKMIDSFSDFLLETKLLSVPFIISERLQGLLENIEHPIAERMINDSFFDTESTEATLIDFDDEEIDKFTYTLPNKFVDVLDKTLNIDFDHIPMSSY